MARPIKEEWRDIPLYKGIYQVSSLGNVRRLDRIVVVGNQAKRFHGQGNLKIFKSKQGYARATFCMGGSRKKFLVHRLVADAFIKNRSPKSLTQINHIDGNKENNCVANLEWCTQKYNRHHAIETGLARGFKATDIKNIKEKIKNGVSTTEIAKSVNRSRQTISDIKFGRHRNLSLGTLK